MQFLQDIVIWFSQYPIVWIFAIYLGIINLSAIIAIWWDKRRARNEGWRVSEVTLLLIGYIGGAIGLIIGMYAFRHKTRKNAFQALTIFSLVVSIIIYWIEYRAILWHLYFS